MRLTQSLCFQKSLDYTIATTAYFSQYMIYWDPTKYTGVESIYFCVVGKMLNATYSATVELWDYLNNIKLATLTFDSTTAAYKTSGDLHDLLTGATILAFKDYIGTASKYLQLGPVQLKVNQNTTAPNRKTMTYIPIFDEINMEYGASWTENEVIVPQVHFGECDGFVKVKLECRAFINYGTSEARFRLWDQTASAVVAGTLTVFTTTTEQHFVTEEITLIAGHEYRFQTYYAEEEADALFRNIAIRIEQSGFEKTAPVLDVSDAGYHSFVAGWQGMYPMSHVDPTLLEAADNLDFWIDFWFDVWLEGAETITSRLYDKTNSAVISGAGHTYSGAQHVSYEKHDQITLTQNADLEMQIDDGESGSSISEIIFRAFMTENFPDSNILYADPTMPTGFNCFLSQFIKNRKVGNVPFKTPDGVNRVW